MKPLKLILILGLMLNFVVIGNSFAEETILFSFEDETTQGFGIAEWAVETNDNALESVGVSEKYALDGKASLEAIVTFRGAIWMQAPIELIEEFDWTPYNTVSASIYLPADAPEGLKAMLVIQPRVGDDWNWHEMSHDVGLAPGKWTVVTAKIKPGETNLKKSPSNGAVFDDISRQNVVKFYVRIISNKKPVYKGSIYVDKISLSD